MITKNRLDELEYQVTGACIEVHKALGPGLLESVYQQCLAFELDLRGISYAQECIVNVIYKGKNLDTRLRADFVIENCMVVELKAVDKFEPIHFAQLLTQMKLLGLPKGLLMNFNCLNIVQDGKKPFVNEFYRKLI